MTAGAMGIQHVSAATQEQPGFTFALLGDLHFDRLEHHDFQWLAASGKPDHSQILRYSELTSAVMPKLFSAVKQQVHTDKATLVLQVGDLVEGLCGSEALARKQNEESLAFVKDAALGAPFLFTKGNHDVTGPGSEEAFRDVFHPFLNTAAAPFAGKLEPDHACYAITHGNAHFLFFDAYSKKSLGWLEAALAACTRRHVCVVIHPPVVPYGARATWNLYAKDKTSREKLLTLLGRRETIVLGGHIHKYSTLQRRTEGGGRFVQVAVSSVISPGAVKAKDELGAQDYTGDQIKVEPKHSPDTEPQRRAVYDAERPWVSQFAYADLPGFAMVRVQGEQVSLRMHAGSSGEAWREVDLMKVLKA
ncbi:calcineurin-like phosphoesterase family protein [Roseimicrobium gellanilyticum]|uniref:Calcineurin-like phosphoesterase family protein n=2 Tax=Roseimicrobium gellanilyticum TaxID=748857 RepID=A0A366H0E8_9BACT|nr:calcineurin-like phosphoesterase family protein [Roseimicrobium gellanilyticum]